MPKCSAWTGGLIDLDVVEVPWECVKMQSFFDESYLGSFQLQSAQKVV